jgi:hydrogenase/urease accessory protein HupE
VAKEQVPLHTAMYRCGAPVEVLEVAVTRYAGTAVYNYGVSLVLANYGGICLRGCD